MRKVLIAWLIASSIGLAETYVLPTRTDLGIFQPNYSLPFDTYTNSTTWLTGQMDGNEMVDFSPDRTDAVIESPCLMFDGVGDYVDSGVQIGLTAPTNKVTFRVKFIAPAPSNEKGLVGQGSTSGSIGLCFSGAGTVRAGCRSSAINSVDSTSIFTEGDIVDAVFEWNGSDTVSLWVNDDDVVTETLAVTGALDNTNIELGSKNGVVAGTARFFDGKILSASFSNYADSSQNFSYSLQESSGSTVYDVSGNGNHGTIVAGGSSLATMWGQKQNVFHDFAIRGGSKVLGFDGVDAYANTGYIPSINTKIVVNGKFCNAGQNDYMGSFNGVLDNYTFGIRSTGSTWFFGWRGSSSTLVSGADYNRHEFIIDGGKFYVDGIEKIDLSGASGAIPAYPLFISARNAAGTPDLHSCFDLDSYEIYESGVLVRSFYSKDAFGTTLPDSTGTNDATLVNTSFVYIPALSSGTNDAAGLRLTNPSGAVHNNGSYGLVFGGVTNTYSMMLTNGHATVDAPLITEYYK